MVEAKSAAVKMELSECKLEVRQRSLQPMYDHMPPLLFAGQVEMVNIEVCNSLRC